MHICLNDLSLAVIPNDCSRSRFFLAVRPGVCHNLIMSTKIKKIWAARILKYLEEKYPETSLPLHFSSPWELLVATQLSAQCTDARVNEVTPVFFRHWPTPEALLNIPIEKVEEIIHSTGFFRNKARNLVACAKILTLKYNGKVPSTMDEMLELPGVARKTANVVLYGAFRKNEGVAVDTHVKRISHRLSLTVSQQPVQIERDLMKLFPQHSWGSVNHRMVLFGRDICRARKPSCDKCALRDECPKMEPPKINAGKAAHEPQPPTQSK